MDVVFLLLCMYVEIFTFQNNILKRLLTLNSTETKYIWPNRQGRFFFFYKQKLRNFSFKGFFFISKVMTGNLRTQYVTCYHFYSQCFFLYFPTAFYIFTGLFSPFNGSSMILDDNKKLVIYFFYE